MKITAILFGIFFSIKALALSGSASLSPVVTNPADAHVFASTGAFVSGSNNPSPSGTYRVEVFASCPSGILSGGCTFDLQTMSGASVVAHTYLNAATGTSAQLKSNISFTIPDGLSLQVVNVGAITGAVQVNLYWAVENVN